MSNGDRIIDPDQAAIVQQVFERYAMGESARAIAARLNAEHLPGPDPLIGQRQARSNPPKDLTVEEVPELRIIGDALWRRLKTRQGAVRDDVLGEWPRDPGAPQTKRARSPR